MIEKPKRKTKRKNSQRQRQMIIILVMVLLAGIGLFGWFAIQPIASLTLYPTSTMTAIYTDNQTVEVYVEQTQDVRHTAIAITSTAIYNNMQETPEATP